MAIIIDVMESGFVDPKLGESRIRRYIEGIRPAVGEAISYAEHQRIGIHREIGLPIAADARGKHDRRAAIIQSEAVSFYARKILDADDGGIAADGV